MRKNLNLEADLRMSFTQEVYSKMNQDLIASFLFYMDCSRKGQPTDTGVLKRFVKYLCSINTGYSENLYSQQLEPLIIQSTVKYYNITVQEFIRSNSYSIYLRAGIKIISQEEEDRLSAYIPNLTVKKIVNNLRDMIFFLNSKYLLESNNNFTTLLSEQNLPVSILFT